MFVLIYNFDFFVRAYTVNNLSNKFAAKDISNGSLNQITTTGFYVGSNITEVTPYIKSYKWCHIYAYVSGNSASIFVIAGDAMALNIYRNGDGIYSYYPIATKSDLPQVGSTAVIDCPPGTTKEASVTFPKAFATAPIVVISPLSDTKSINGIPKYSVKNVTPNGFLIKLYNDDNDTRSTVFYWMAMAKL